MRFNYRFRDRRILFDVNRLKNINRNVLIQKKKTKEVKKTKKVKRFEEKTREVLFFLHKNEMKRKELHRYSPMKEE